MSTTPQNKKKPVKQNKDAIEKYPPPEIENLVLDQNYVLKCSLTNDYQSICGAFDAKEHPLASYIIENSLFNKKNDFGKSPFDLAAYLGHKDFIRAILQRTDEKLDENVFDLRALLKPSNNYNFLHYACIWGRIDLVKFLIEQTKLIVDPSVDLNEQSTNSNNTLNTNKNQNTNPNTKTLGSILLRSKNKIGETAKAIAKRYNHEDLVEYLNYAEKRQNFIDSVNDVKQLALDPEKNQNKLSKDDKKKLEKVYSDVMDWLEKNKESTDLRMLEIQIKETEEEVKPILEKLMNNDMNSTSVITNGSTSSRSKR